MKRKGDDSLVKNKKKVAKDENRSSKNGDAKPKKKITKKITGDVDLNALVDKLKANSKQPKEPKNNNVPSKKANDEVDEEVSFESVGLTPELCEACRRIGWKTPSQIQQKVLPPALEDRDIIGLAETGSGKTGAFALPVLQTLLAKPQAFYALVLAPTRELAVQISDQFEALGTEIGLKTAVVVGGIDMMTQALALAKRPHVIIATPGRLVDHLENTKGFNLKNVKYLILDEADRLLTLDFEVAIDKILKVLPTDRRSYLFSATMTSKVQKLQRASLVDPVKVEVSSKYQTVKTLVQQYAFLPQKYKDCYLAYTLNEFNGNSTIVFTGTCNNAQRSALILRNLGFSAVAIHGQMSQPSRLGALAKFKSGNRSILIATDVASRGLDIPSVDLVINYDVPTHSKDYIHRVGRTARAGRSGRAITFVTQYDVEIYQRIEQMLGQKLDLFKSEEEEVLLFLERVSESQRMAAMTMKEQQQKQADKKKGGHGGSLGGDQDDTGKKKKHIGKFGGNLKRRK